MLQVAIQKGLNPLFILYSQPIPSESYERTSHELDSKAYIIMSEVADIFSNNMDKA